jgi:hypothetical protein
MGSTGATLYTGETLAANRAAPTLALAQSKTARRLPNIVYNSRSGVDNCS